MVVERISSFVERATQQWDQLTVTLIALLLALAVHHLMILGTLRRVRSEVTTHRLIKKEYAAIPLVYDFISFSFILLGVILILLLWFWPWVLVPFVGVLGVIFLAIMCFILSGYTYLVGVSRAAIQVIQELLKKYRS